MATILVASPTRVVADAAEGYGIVAEELSAEEAAAFWPRVLQVAPDYARNPRRTSRRIPMVRLVPVGPGEGAPS